MRGYLNKNTELVTKFFRQNVDRHPGLNSKGAPVIKNSPNTFFQISKYQPEYVFNFDRLVARNFLTFFDYNTRQHVIEPYPDLQLGWKITKSDFSTSNDFKWQPFKWNVPEIGNEVGLFDKPMTTGEECPSFPGDGLCLAKTWKGAQSGSIYVHTAGTKLLLVAYKPSDVLHDQHLDKFRVRKCFVLASDTVGAFKGWVADNNLVNVELATTFNLVMS